MRLCVAIACFLLFAHIRGLGQRTHREVRSGKVNFANLPLAFEPNVGQGLTGDLFITRSGAMEVGFAIDGIVMHLPSKTRSRDLKMILDRSASDARLTGELKEQGESNYLLGNAPESWKTHIPQYERLMYSGIYRGIDLAFYGTSGRLEHDFVVRPGADYRQIRMRYQGAEKVSVASDGDLCLQTGGGEVLIRAPYIYQDLLGERRKIHGGFVLVGENEVAFKVDEFDRSVPLVIDPVMDYSTYLADVTLFVSQATSDAAGNTYIVGQVSLPTYPVTPGAFQGTCPACTSNPELFITKLNPTGTAQVYSTLLGGSGQQQARGLTVDGNGNAIVTGWTSSADFPMKNPISAGVASYADGFITSLSADGSSLNFSSRLGGAASAGGSAGTYPWATAADSSGNVYVAGTTESTYVPVTPGALNAGTPGYQNGFYVFLLKLTPAGAQTYGAILGATGSASSCCSLSGMTVDANQNVYLAGTVGVTTFTSTTPWPTTPGAYQTQMISPGQIAPFVAEVSADASKFIYSTLATTGGLSGVTWNSKHEAILVGSPNYNFPVTADAYSAHTGTSFIARMSADGSHLLYSTYFSTATADTGGSISQVALDAAENVWIAGKTFPYTSNNVPLVNPLISTAGSTSAFVMEFDPAIQNILFSTYLNGPSGANIAGLAIDGAGHAHVAGFAPNDFPTTPGVFLGAAGTPPASVSAVYGFAAVIDASTPGPAICSGGAATPATQLGSSSQGSVNFTNCGNAPLQVSTAQLSGNSAFTALSTNVCVGTLAAGASCSYGYSFAPTVAGYAGATFTVASNAPFSPFSIAVSGYATAPVINLLQTSVTFAPQVFGDSASATPYSVLVFNKGTAPLIVNAAQLSVTGPFTIMKNSCTSPVQPQGPCSIQLGFVPTAVGTSTGTLTIASNDPVSPAVSVALSGSALASYPQPTITSLNPASVLIGSAAQKITISGTNFFPTSTIIVGGEKLAVTGYGSYILTFTIDPSLLTTVGEVPVTVVNPSSGGASNTFPLMVVRSVSVSAASLVYNGANQLLYASIPSTSATNPNTVVSIDPTTGTAGKPISVGVNPGKLALSSDGAYLYVGLDGDHTLQRINLSTSQVDRTFALPVDSLTGATTVFNMQSVPGSPTSVVVALRRPASPGEAGAVLYNDAGQVSFIGNTFQNKNYGIDDFTFTSDPTVFYAYPFGTTFFAMTGVSATGLTVVNQPGGACCNQATGSIVASDGTLLYTNSGEVWNPSTQTLLGTYSRNPALFYEPSIVPDTPNKRTYFLDESGGAGPVILSFDQGSYAQVGSATISGASNPLDLTRWGVDGFAFRQFTGLSTDQIWILRSSLTHTAVGGTPTLTSLSPSTVAAGVMGTQVAVSGAGFVPGATVLWNGEALETSYISSSQIVALIPSAQLVASGTAQVTVANPSPGGVSSGLTFTITSQSSTAITLTSSSNPVFFSNPITFTASLSSASGGSAAPPSGSVSFFDGANQLGTAAISNGKASYSSSNLTTGSHSITGVYSGDANYAKATSAALTELIVNFTVAPPGGGTSSATVQPGGQANYTLLFSPPSGQTFPAAISFSVSGLPSGATATFSPTSIPAGAGATTVTLSISIPATARLDVPLRPFKELPPISIGLVFLPLAAFRRKRLTRCTKAARLLVTAILVVSVAGLSSCGGGGGSHSSSTPQTYTLNLTATSGSLSNSTTLTLIVQ